MKKVTLRGVLISTYSIILITSIIQCSDNDNSGRIEMQDANIDSEVFTDSSVESNDVRATTLRVAAVQMKSINGDISSNLRRASELIEQAASQGAELILLPEFMATGYVYNTEIWNAAEVKDGPTVEWLRENAKRLGVWLGTSFLEVDGEDFYNTFVLMTPEGEEAGRVRKQTPAAFEAYFFKGDTGSHLIETDLGKIGVGICYENYQCFLMQLMFEGSADLILMPHSFPRVEGLVDVSGGFISEFYATRFGVPVVMVNKTGDWSSPFFPDTTVEITGAFPGISAIADSDGNVIAELDDSESVIVETVSLDPARKTENQPPCEGQWISPDIESMMEIFPSIEEEGRKWYESSSERREKAISVSSSR